MLGFLRQEGGERALELPQGGPGARERRLQGWGAAAPTPGEAQGLPSAGSVQTEVSLLSLIIKTSEKYEEENKDHLSPHWADFGPV